MKLVSFLFLPIVVVICLVGDVSCQRQDNRNYNQPAEARGSTGGRGPPIKSHGETPKWPASDGADGGFTEPEPEPDFGEMLREFDSFTKVFNEEWRQLLGYGGAKDHRSGNDNGVYDVYGGPTGQYNEYGGGRHRKKAKI